MTKNGSCRRRTTAHRVKVGMPERHHAISPEAKKRFPPFLASKVKNPHEREWMDQAHVSWVVSPCLGSTSSHLMPPPYNLLLSSHQQTQEKATAQKKRYSHTVGHSCLVVGLGGESQQHQAKLSMASCAALRALAVLWVAAAVFRARPVDGLAVNWGTRALRPLPGDITVRLLRDNGFDKVKLFEPDPPALKALGHSGIQVMVGLPNELLTRVAGSVSAAEQWVLQNVSTYISKYGVDIRSVAVGNEPFLKSYKGQFEAATLPAVQNIQAALVKAGLGRQIRVTVPLNADVYEAGDGKPSSGDFRPDIQGLMVNLVRFLLNNNGILAINIYPFLSMDADPNFPKDYAFFPAPGAPPSQASVQDGNVLYTNVFDANYDTLIAALEKHGLGSIPVVVGEIGWPTDGDQNANIPSAQKFNEGLFDRIVAGKGTPRRPQMPDIYVFALLDEDAKSVDPGNFERHWGIFNYDGSPKYTLRLANGRPIVPAKGVRYLSKQWCVLRQDANPNDPSIGGAVQYACQYSDCTSLSPGSSCGSLDARGNVSYAFNQYFQAANQMKNACAFNNLSVITTTDPSQGNCSFHIQIDTGKHVLIGKSAAGRASATWTAVLALGFIALVMAAW